VSRGDISLFSSEPAGRANPLSPRPCRPEGFTHRNRKRLSGQESLAFKLSAASKIAAVAELSASIAHQLNQPFMAVLGNAQAAKRWLATNPPNLVETTASIE
jgi:C4-dicarboxylate-specific signal transduction histidine kinase